MKKYCYHEKNSVDINQQHNGLVKKCKEGILLLMLFRIFITNLI